MSTLTLTPAVTLRKRKDHSDDDAAAAAAAPPVKKLPYTSLPSTLDLEHLPRALRLAHDLCSQAQNDSLSKSEEDSIIKEAMGVSKKVEAFLRPHPHAGHFAMNLVNPEVRQQCVGIQSVIRSVYHTIYGRRDANAHTLVVPERSGYQRMAWEHHQMMNPNRVD
jgi:hypothetical protein